ncbi:MAG: hypothetical protein JXA90_13720 [Planctomycetes bacterium]|nr:hypothetical protein [Planctomycetota bacterium]
MKTQRHLLGDRALARLRRLLLCLAASACGCAGKVRIDELPPEASLRVVLDANSRVAVSGRALKFFVDIHNTSGRPLDLADIEIELRASPRDEPETISLRKEWPYRWKQEITLPPDRKISLPIVPESTRAYNPQLQQVVTISEFPLELLEPGEYAIRAWVNGRFPSDPYILRVHRGDLPAMMPASRPAGGHALR